MKIILLFLLGSFLFVHYSNAQTCSGTWGPPIVDQTFGQGDSATQFYAPLSTYAPGVTTSTTFITGPLSDNYSCLTYNASFANNWVDGPDHTGNPYGLMFLINAPSSGGTVFVQYTMHDLCPNTTLQLGVWILNVDVDTCACGRQYPNMTMEVVDPVTNTVLDSTNTGNVPFDAAWHQYTMVFNNGNSSTLVLKFINNSVGSGDGNDLALDDITVSPCVPITHISPKVDTTIICQPSIFIPFTANITGNVYSPAEYQWQYSSDMGATWVNAGPVGTTTTYYFTASAVGTYWVRFLTGPVGFSGNSNCSAISDTSIITIAVASLPPPAVTSPIVYCQNAIANTLTATGTGIAWYTTDTGTVPLPGAPLPNTAVADTTHYFVTQQKGICISPPDSITVIVNPLPIFTTTSNAPICLGSTLLLAASAATQYISYSWAGPGGFNGLGSNQSIPDITTAGVYTVTGLLNGCADSLHDTVAIYPLPVSAIGADINGILCTGDSLVLTINNYDPTATYQWAPTDFFPVQNNAARAVAIVSPSGNIYLTTTTASGCTATDSLLLNVQPCCIVSFPNAFTPNGDGKNDIFRPVTIGNYAAFYFLVVNRWGQKVFESYNERTAWDGTFNGIPQDIGVYNYYIRYQCNGRLMEEKGDVTLIR